MISLTFGDFMRLESSSLKPFRKSVSVWLFCRVLDYTSESRVVAKKTVLAAWRRAEQELGAPIDLWRFPIRRAPGKAAEDCRSPRRCRAATARGEFMVPIRDPERGRICLRAFLHR
jgi:hypothetical protein